MENVIKEKLKKLKRKFPDLDVEGLEKELIPLHGKEVKIKKKKI